LFITTVEAQKKPQKIKYRHADVHKFDSKIDAEAQMMIGHVEFEHEGTILSCDSAVFFQGKNVMRAFGNVEINQADTLHMYSNYLEYDGNTKLSFAYGDVILIDSKMELKSDTVHFDRNKQIAYYPAFGEIKDSANVLTSIKGTYYTTEKKFIFTSDVTVTNDKYIMKSDHLIYYTTPKTVYFYGPSTITSEDNFIYCENGFYDTRNENSYFKKNSYINYGAQTLRGDSLYYDRNTGFGSATNNIVVNDTTKDLIIKGEYAEYFEKKDSTFVTERAVAINVMENDSLFIHGDTLMMTLIPYSKNRIMRVFHGVKIFKKDMQGKCDSLSYNESLGEMKMIDSPILWSGVNQLTSDTIIVTSNPETQKLDSLKLINNGFIISNDTIINYNQIKGKNIYGKFKNNELDIINVVGNSETIYYARNEKNELIGINKAVSSSMLIRLKDNEINEISFIREPEAELSPNSKIPENARKLKGFIWREDERFYKKEDIFSDSPLQVNKETEIGPINDSSEIIEDIKNNIPNNTINNQIKAEVIRTKPDLKKIKAIE
jgi:lipopolysaccharide export system protein LptA